MGRASAPDGATETVAGAKTEATVAREAMHDGAQARWLDRGARWALVTFVVVEVAAAVVFLRAGREQWFHLDEWDFLADRSLGDPAGLFRPHFDHWVTLPIVPYRLLWSIFGLRTYLPYQALAIATHLAVAGLVRAVMRRSGASPWLATAGASGIALFGAGNENIVWAFQITFGGALAFGLAQLLLATHDGPLGRRDVLGLMAGLAAIMCAGPGVVMTGVVGLSSCFARRWRAALLHTVPLAVVYAAWLLLFGESSLFAEAGPVSLRVALDFAWTGLSSGIEAVGQLPAMGWLVGAVAAAGVAVAVRSRGMWGFVSDSAPAISLAIGAPAFLLLTSLGRGAYYGSERAQESRYLYMVAAMVLPLVVVAFEVLTRRWQWTSVPAIALLLIGLPGNVAAADDGVPLGDPKLVSALASAPAVHVVPPETRAAILPNITAGWLRDGMADGSIPPLRSDDGRLDALANLSWALERRESMVAERTGCRLLSGRVRHEFEAGDSIRFHDQGLVIIDPNASPPPVRLDLDPGDGEVLEFRAGVELVLAPLARDRPPLVCGLPG